MLHAHRNPDAKDHIIHSERDAGMSAGAVQVWFHRLYQELGFSGASSHSGRRTFITRIAKKIVEAGGSLRDVQELAGHASLSTTQRYIQGDSAAKRRVVDMSFACNRMPPLRRQLAAMCTWRKKHITVPMTTPFDGRAGVLH
jgi:integrase/recombinase XerD